MIIDLDHHPDALTFQADACIIGAGAAGITLAIRLIEAGWTVCLLEAGGFATEAEQQALFDAESVGEPINPVEGRYRLFGGATAYWTGRCATLDPIDFERRDWVSFSGWPIDAATLTPYYRAAEAMCGFRTSWSAENERLAHLKTLAPMAFDVAPFLWRFAPVRRNAYQHWGQRFRTILGSSARARVILHANLTDLEQSPGESTVRIAVARSLRGAVVRVTSRHHILCCGGIENARLVLNAARRSQGSLRSTSKTAGRWFMQHPRAHVGNIVAPGSEQRVQHLLNRFVASRGTEYETGFALSDRTQRADQLLNASAVLRYSPQPGSLRGALSEWRKSGDWKKLDLRPIRPKMSQSLALASDAWRWAAGRHAPLRSPQIRLIVDLEQEPNAHSKVVLSDHMDRLGLHRARIDWRIGPLERKTSIRIVEGVDRWLRGLSLGHVEPVPNLADHGALTSEHMFESYHHLAATRMSSRPDEGVVDGDCRVHGVANLHICGASVMPTGGHANPTFTIVALALRLADRLVSLRD